MRWLVFRLAPQTGTHRFASLLPHPANTEAASLGVRVPVQAAAQHLAMLQRPLLHCSRAEHQWKLAPRGHLV